MELKTNLFVKRMNCFLLLKIIYLCESLTKEQHRRYIKYLVDVFHCLIFKNVFSVISVLDLKLFSFYNSI